MSTQRLQILYIGGSGRSGSTLLARMLGELPGCVNIGELALSLVDRDLRVFETPCGCGRPESECDFWRQVNPRASGHIRELGLPFQAGSLGLVWRRFRRDAAYRQALLDLLDKLYRRIAAAAEAEWIIETSKNPIPGRILRQLPEARFALLHLVRDARGVVTSWRRRKDYLPKLPPGRMIREWWRANLGIERLAREADLSWRWRWEDFLQTPAEHLAQLLRELGQGDAELSFLGEKVVRLVRPQHVLFGNPVKLQSGEIRLEMPELPAGGAGRAMVTALTWPLLRRYGYLK